MQFAKYLCTQKLANYVETRRTTTGTGIDHIENDAPMDDDDQIDENETIFKYLLDESDIIRPTKLVFHDELEDEGMEVSPRASVASVDSPTTTTLDDKEAAIVRKSLGIVKQAGIIRAKNVQISLKTTFFSLEMEASQNFGA